jgi:hypothetical protein
VDDSVVSLTLFRFRRLNREKMAVTIRSSMAMAAPPPMPALAAIERPTLDAGAGGAEGAAVAKLDALVPTAAVEIVPILLMAPLVVPAPVALAALNVPVLDTCTPSPRVPFDLQHPANPKVLHSAPNESRNALPSITASTT